MKKMLMMVSVAMLTALSLASTSETAHADEAMASDMDPADETQLSSQSPAEDIQMKCTIDQDVCYVCFQGGFCGYTCCTRV